MKMKRSTAFIINIKDIWDSYVIIIQLTIIERKVIRF